MLPPSEKLMTDSPVRKRVSNLELVHAVFCRLRHIRLQPIRRWKSKDGVRCLGLSYKQHLKLIGSIAEIKYLKPERLRQTRGCR